MVTIDSITVANYESTLGTGTNDLENDTRAHSNPYSGHVEGAGGLFGNLLDTGNITASTGGSNFDHKCCVKDALLSNCDTKESIDDNSNSNCDTCLMQDEYVRLGSLSPTSLDFVDHDQTYQPFCLENDFWDITLVKDSTFEDMMSCFGSDKPSETHKSWSLLPDRWSYAVKNMPIWVTYIHTQG